MSRPLIGIAPKFLPSDDGPTELLGARRSVIDSVRAAGGEPVVLCCEDLTQASDALDAVSAIVMPGGGDSDPALYGETERHPNLRLVQPLQDSGDIAIINAALTRRMPMLAICRGMQTLNIALGGSLVQHLEPSSVEHWDNVHDIEITELDSLTAQVVGSAALIGVSFHQQAVRRLGRDLRITARAADGGVEAIEHTTAPALGLQWHPELQAEGCPVQFEPFVWLVDSAKRG
ncbi:gamma-glutamyl-gamma-aminobutyrate hydrolase family protein [Leekyejoonella antrihumi]|uniref:gamma-glutamyl-gamma-aminobutyrate hydrolase family protein n=1 Tax=Leekyejoonella antrihumi TaxID=1660198 RepID=UPI0016443422|nr:gamma-glutamyl-gamma-aminobutyrate hydrolase family protein [Leekyejoonella antrihumi]